METKAFTKVKRMVAVKAAENKQEKKSKLVLFWETIPENRFEIVDMRAILK